jgi:hypothetical protein
MMVLNALSAATRTTNHHNLLRGVAGVVFVLALSAAIFMEILVAISIQIERRDSNLNQTTVSGAAWLRFIHGPGLRGFRRRTLVVAAVSGVVTLAAFVV